jgi:hypothetical protein
MVALIGAAMVASGLTSCGHHDAPPWDHLTWRAVQLPVPAGERALVRGATWCDDRWVVVGATADARGNTKPAVWASGDGRQWRTLPLDPGGDFYAARAVLTSVGCAHGRLAVLGARSGGAHGNPRTASWRELPDGSLAAVRAPFELYGGQNAVAVNRLVGGPRGYLIAGTRVRGAAVWSSRDGHRFRLHEGAPGLASTSQVSTQAVDAAWWHGVWTVVGVSSDDTGRLTATAWTGSGAGPWTPTSLPGGGTITTAERLALTGVGPVAVGLDDQGFGVWADRQGRWSQESTFAAKDPDGTSAAYISGAAWTGSLLAATYSDGARFRLAIGATGGLDVVPLPVTVTVRGDHTVTIATHLDDAVLLTDDGAEGRVWLTRVPGPTS